MPSYHSPVLAHRRAMLIEGILLLAILTLAAWLRLTGLDRTSLFGDEAVYSGQAAALAGNPASESNFGIFLAHPLLFYLLLAGGFVAGIPAEGGRVLTALFGVASVGVAWALGRRVGGRPVGLAAALVLAVLAYHSYISRLVELDGPAGFLIGCSLYAFVRAESAQSVSWLAAAAAVLGLAAITKETALVVLPAVALCAVIDGRLRMGLRAWLLAAVSFATVFAAFPIAVGLGGGSGSAWAYLEYQIGRQAQSSPLTYVELIDPYFGWLFVVLVGLGIVASLWARGPQRIVAIWVVVPLAILQAWGLRELQLPMIVAVQLAVLAAVSVDRTARAAAAAISAMSGRASRRDGLAWAFRGAMLVVVGLTLVPLTLRVTSLPDGQPEQSGLREASVWLRDHAEPLDGIFVSTAYKSSVVAYYSGRPAYGFIPRRRRDPVYRDPGDIDAVWRSGGIRWVVLGRGSRTAADRSEDDRAPYTRLVALLELHDHELAYEVLGATPDDWLARIYSTQGSTARPSVEPLPVVGRGDRRIAAMTYAVCIALGIGIVLIARRWTRSQRERVDG